MMHILPQLLRIWQFSESRSAGTRNRRRVAKRLRCETLENRRFLAADIFPVVLADATSDAGDGEAAVAHAEDCPYIQSLQVDVMAAVESTPADVFVSPGDFNADGRMDIADLDALTAAIASNSSDMSFDLTLDNSVDHGDLDSWLRTSGEVNLGPGKAYFQGDADLDGEVDIIDWHHMNWHMFTSSAAWSSGDFNADGVIDGSDVGLWNKNKYQAPSEGRPVSQQNEKVAPPAAQAPAVVTETGHVRKLRAKLSTASQELRM
jgi:hypothetical protein